MCHDEASQAHLLKRRIKKAKLSSYEASAQKERILMPSNVAAIVTSHWALLVAEAR